MSKITFSISELIEQAWTKFKEQPFLWVSITIITIIVGYLGGGLDMDPETFETTFNPIGFIASFWMGEGLSKPYWYIACNMFCNTLRIMYYV